MSHGHSHGACGGDSDHGHDHPDEEMGKMYSLYLKIDTERLQCLNEARDGSGKTVFKPWDQRKDKEKVGTTIRALTQRLKGRIILLLVVLVLFLLCVFSFLFFALFLLESINNSLIVMHLCGQWQTGVCMHVGIE